MSLVRGSTEAKTSTSFEPYLDVLIRDIFALIPPHIKRGKKRGESLNFQPVTKKYDSLSDLKADPDYPTDALSSLYESLIIIKKSNFLSVNVDEWTKKSRKAKIGYCIKKIGTSYFTLRKHLKALDPINKSWTPIITDKLTFEMTRDLISFLNKIVGLQIPEKEKASLHFVLRNLNAKIYDYRPTYISENIKKLSDTIEQHLEQHTSLTTEEFNQLALTLASVQVQLFEPQKSPIPGQQEEIQALHQKLYQIPIDDNGQFHSLNTKQLNDLQDSLQKKLVVAKAHAERMALLPTEKLRRKSPRLFSALQTGMSLVTGISAKMDSELEKAKVICAELSHELNRVNTYLTTVKKEKQKALSNLIEEKCIKPLIDEILMIEPTQESQKKVIQKVITNIEVQKSKILCDPTKSFYQKTMEIKIYAANHLVQLSKHPTLAISTKDKILRVLLKIAAWLGDDSAKFYAQKTFCSERLFKLSRTFEVEGSPQRTRPAPAA